MAKASTELPFFYFVRKEKTNYFDRTIKASADKFSCHGAHPDFCI
jgi:hypothetical protein